MYSRETELRHLKPNDVYKLGVILDENNCWKKLMELIPKETKKTDMSKEKPSVFKYNNDHIRLIEDAIKRPGESRLYSQILIDEWGTSGRKLERPTVGVLLQLLVQAELYRAADFVAINFLNEPPPQRPLIGPAAKIDVSLSDDIFEDIEDLVNDSSYFPGTSSINDNVNYDASTTDNNKDFYNKYHNAEKHLIDKNNEVPKPPPRMRSTRLRIHSPQLPDAQHAIIHGAGTEDIPKDEHDFTNLTTSEYMDSTKPISDLENIPKLTELITNSRDGVISEIPEASNTTLSTHLSETSIPMLSALVRNLDSNIVDRATHTGELPIISTLNINGERENDNVSNPEFLDESRNQERRSSYTSSSSLSNESMDDLCLPPKNRNNNDNEGCEESSVPNLSIFDQNSSNNDSSLTTVTGTSEENSFELSNDASSVSNDDNIPCLSALK